MKRPGADWGRINRIRLGNIRTLLRFRYGPTLPDDDAGYEDLRILLHVKARCFPPARRERALRMEAETWAPWLNGRIDGVVSEVSSSPLKLTSKRLGEAFNLTSAERDRLSIWQIRAVGTTDEDIRQRRRQRDRERRRRKRLKAGGRSRAEYFARPSTEKDKPWVAAGISRRAWYRNAAVRRGKP